MRKTTVYLDDELAEQLSRLARVSGRSQAELLREGVGRILEDAPKREFRSLGKGRGGLGNRGWDAGELYRRRRGGSEPR